MENVDPQILGAVSVMSGVAFAMVWLAARLHLLERQAPRRCPSCGLVVQRGGCRCSR